MLIIGRIALAWLLFIGLAYADGVSGGVGVDGLNISIGNGIGGKGGSSSTTGYTWSGPSTGTAGSPSTNFTVTAVGSAFSGSQTITISDGSKGGTITPSVGSPGTSTVTVTPTNGSSNFTFTYTAVLGDTITLTGTNGQGWSNPSPLTYKGAVTYTMTGPSTGTAGSPSTNFTVSMPAGVKFSGTDTITIADGSKGGTITPSVGSPGTSTVTVTPAVNATSFTYTYTAVLGDTVTLTPTNAQSWTNPTALTYKGAVTYTASGPSSGVNGSPSSNFTVSMPGSVTFSGSDTITIADGSKGGTLTPSVGSPGTSTVTVTPTNGATSFTFTYTPAAVGEPTLTFTNAQSWTNAAALTYGSGTCTQSAALLARMDGGQNSSAVDTLICGMVTDSTYSLLDGLHVFATNSTTNALLNWAQNNYNLTSNGSVTFTANHGYASDGTTGYLSSTFNPSTATTPNYVQNSATLGHCTATSNTTVSSSIIPLAVIDGTHRAFVVPVASGSVFSADINTSAAGASSSNANHQGSYITTRTGSTTTIPYKNGVALSTVATASVTPPNLVFYFLAFNNGGTAGDFYSTFQIAWALYGGGLTSTQVGNIRTRLNTYLTAVGGTGSC